MAECKHYWIDAQEVSNAAIFWYFDVCTRCGILRIKPQLLKESRRE